jgi:RimJ/RimL family protein N-acetyltransferase
VTKGAPIRDDVRLAPLAMEHANAMFRWMEDPTVSTNLGLRSTPSLEKTRAWIARALQDESVHAFAVLQQDRHVGNVVLDRLDSVLASTRLSVYVGEAAARGCGVGRTAIHLALHRAFHDLGLSKVWLTVHAKNVPAISTYLAVGFVLEGVLREEFVLEGKRLPALYMGILASELPAT